MGTIYYINTEERALKASVFQALSLERIAREDAGEEETGVAAEVEVEKKTETEEHTAMGV